MTPEPNHDECPVAECLLCKLHKQRADGGPVLSDDTRPRRTPQVTRLAEAGRSKPAPAAKQRRGLLYWLGELGVSNLGVVYLCGFLSMTMFALSGGHIDAIVRGRPGSMTVATVVATVAAILMIYGLRVSRKQWPRPARPDQSQGPLSDISQTNRSRCLAGSLLAIIVGLMLFAAGASTLQFVSVFFGAALSFAGGCIMFMHLPWR